jgi:hypothetical protein
MFILLHFLRYLDERTKLKIVAVFAVILTIIGIGCSFSAWHDYRTLGTSPTKMTIEQAVPSPDSTPDEARWVNLTGITQRDCSEVFELQSNGKAFKQSFFVADYTSERIVYVTAKMKDGGCANFPQPASGILKKADSGLPDWLTKKGLHVPKSKYPLMELEVGGDASSARLDVYVGLALLLLGLSGCAVSLTKLSGSDNPSTGAKFYDPAQAPATGAIRQTPLAAQKPRA